jgi:hypothetical protein
MIFSKMHSLVYILEWRPEIWWWRWSGLIGFGYVAGSLTLGVLVVDDRTDTL